MNRNSQEVGQPTDILPMIEIERDLSERDRFFQNAQWEAIAKSPERMIDAAKQIITLTSVLSGLYFTSLHLPGIESAANEMDAGAVLLLPYLPWICSFVLAVLAHRPTLHEVWRDDPESTEEAFVRSARWRSRLITGSTILLGLGIILMWISAYCLFIGDG